MAELLPCLDGIKRIHLRLLRRRTDMDPRKLNLQSFINPAPKPAMLSRRAMLRDAACGFGYLGLGSLLAEAASLAGAPEDPLTPKAPHFPARAKRVIFLFMHGGPSHIDTFDPKPRLTRDHGKPLPFKRPLTFAENSVGNLLKSPWELRKYGSSELEISELFP